MPAPYNIQYLTRKEINKTKWDNCIDTAPNGLIYSYSFYLDNMAKQWDALVLNDYEAVMPLTWNKKFGIYYLYQPFFTAQSGISGKHINEQLFSAFLHNIPAKFRYWDFFLNHSNLFYADKYYLYERSNYILDLNKPYEILYAGYRENIKRNIKKAMNGGCSVKKDFDVREVTRLAAQLHYNKNITAEDFKRFENLYALLHQQHRAITYGVFSSTNQLLASCVFFFSHGRAYYILVANHPNGRTLGASHALIDAFIKDHAEKKLLLDFEGSDIRNLAFFYSSFGAAEEVYAAIKMNNLPLWLKWLKK